jgi:hypothetical protein
MILTACLCRSCPPILLHRIPRSIAWMGFSTLACRRSPLATARAIDLTAPEPAATSRSNGLFDRTTTRGVHPGRLGIP